MKFLFKITTWEEVEVSHHEAEVLQLIKEDKITASHEIFEIDADASCKILKEGEEQMSVQENGGCATIEVLDGDETIFKNAEY